MKCGTSKVNIFTQCTISIRFYCSYSWLCFVLISFVVSFERASIIITFHSFSKLATGTEEQLLYGREVPWMLADHHSPSTVLSQCLCRSWAVCAVYTVYCIPGVSLQLVLEALVNSLVSSLGLQPRADRGAVWQLQCILALARPVCLKLGYVYPPNSHLIGKMVINID
jgi:hypothetical protein